MRRLMILTLMAGFMVAFANPAHGQVNLKVSTAVADTYQFTPTEPILEAADAFELIELFAVNTRDHAADLKSFFLQPTAHSWEAHGSKLARIRDNVNDLADRLDRLHTLEVSFLPRQELALSHIMPDAAVLADNTQRAIKFLNENHGTRWDAKYEMYISEIYERADGIAQAAAMTESRLNVQDYLENLSR